MRLLCCIVMKKLSVIKAANDNTTDLFFDQSKLKIRTVSYNGLIRLQR